MTVLYADPGALRAAYGTTEDAAAWRAELLEGPAAVMTSELTRVELARPGPDAAGSAAALARFDLDAGPGGVLVVLRLAPELVLPAAAAIATVHDVDPDAAVHLATAVAVGRPLAAPEDVVFVTPDASRRDVAAALGLGVA